MRPLRICQTYSFHSNGDVLNRSSLSADRVAPINLMPGLSYAASVRR